MTGNHVILMIGYCGNYIMNYNNIQVHYQYTMSYLLQPIQKIPIPAIKLVENFTGKSYVVAQYAHRDRSHACKHQQKSWDMVLANLV